VVVIVLPVYAVLIPQSCVVGRPRALPATPSARAWVFSKSSVERWALRPALGRRLLMLDSVGEGGVEGRVVEPVDVV
jgi:hypothetical protein